MAIVPRVLIPFFFIITALFGGVQKSHGNSADSPAQVELISASTATEGARNVLVGLKIKLQGGWKLYAPEADNPISLEISWDGSKNIKKETVIWPKPKKFTQLGVEVYGYEGEVFLPISMVLKDPKQPLEIKAKVTYSVCSDVCVPLEETLTLTVPSGPGQKTVYAQKLKDIQEGLEIQEEVSFILMLSFAFLGGLILNFMPCVLPVLSLKMMSIAKQSKRTVETSHYRAGMLATSAGILTSFLILGSGALILDSLGESVGWGQHFQQPSFLVFLIVVVTLFACNLWGFYEIALPPSFQHSISSVLGYSHSHYSVIAEDFIAGVFAALLATPCSAPFLGTAMGYAFSRSGIEIIVFFLSIGLGFSAPYWLGALLPRRWIKFPKPGKWMITFSKTMGIVLALTAIWLIWVLAGSLSSLAAVAAAILMIAIVFSFWLGQTRPQAKKVIWAFVLLTLALPILTSEQVPLLVTKRIGHEHWETFDAAKIPTHVAEGKVVFVDITADWCLTCKVNKTLVLNTERVTELLKEKDVVAMQADWTRHNSDITKFLKGYGRVGIPFNAVFGPKAPQGIILSEILKTEDISEALKKARSGDD